MATPRGAKAGRRAARNMTTRHGKLHRSSSLRNGLKVLFSMLLAVAISGIAVAAYAVWDLSNQLTTIELDGGPDLALGSKQIEGAFNVLVVGSDSRKDSSIDDGEEGELNDVTMMMHVSEDHKSATVVSFPRDLMLPIPSCPGPNGEENYYSAMSEQQLNSTLGYGLPCVVDTIEELTGADIPYAGMITFDGVINMSNAVGGVDVCLAEPIYDPKTDLDLPAGDVTLVGKDALQFLRTRHGVGDGGDTSRISNQQVFLSALMRKVQDGSTLADPVKVYGLAKAAIENMTLSSNMASVNFMQAVAATLRDINLDQITFVQYPAAEHPYETSRLVPDTYAGDLLMEKVLNDQPFELAGTGSAVATEDGEPADNGEDVATEQTPEPEENATPDDGVDDGTTEEGSEDGTEDGTDQSTLPENVTGQRASAETCSAGRTNY
ncbi:MAG: LCP family glycopolymer transferase [Canibacter sp.]